MDHWNQLKETIDINNVSKENWQSIYDIGGWEEEGSGPGSKLDVNSELISYLSNFISSNNIASVVDFGCGDLQWANQLFSDSISYVGVDFIQNIISSNLSTYPNQSFICEDIFNITETYELVICKDLLHHARSNAASYFSKINEVSSRYSIVVGPTYMKNREVFTPLFEQYNYEVALDFISDEKKTIFLASK